MKRGRGGPSIEPGLDIERLMDTRSFFLHLLISSSILSILAGFMAHRHPFFVFPLLFGFSIFSKHLLRDRLWRTEFCKHTNEFFCTSIPSKSKEADKVKRQLGNKSFSGENCTAIASLKKNLGNSRRDSMTLTRRKKDKTVLEQR